MPAPLLWIAQIRQLIRTKAKREQKDREKHPALPTNPKQKPPLNNSH